MTAKTIWYINPYSGGPGIGPAFRPYFLAREWIAAGHNPAVITARFHHLLDNKSPLAAQLDVEGVPYHTLPARSYDGNGVDRFRNMLDFTINLRRLANHRPKTLAKPDAVIASSPHPFAVYSATHLAKTFNARLVFEIRDLWPLSLTELAGMSPYHPFAMACATAERYAYRKADVIASVLPRADKYLAEKGFGQKPFVWVPNGLSSTPMPPADLSCTNTRLALDIIKSAKAEQRVVLIHAGSMGPPNGLLELLDALETSGAKNSRDRFSVLLIGGGILENEIAERAAHGPCQVDVVGRVAKSNVATIIQSADIGYCGLVARDNLYRYGVSLNKFADYFGAGLPGLLPIGPCKDPVSESGGGIARAAPTAEALWSLINELIEMSDEERQEMGQKGKAYMQREYDTKRIAQRYIDAIF